MSQTLRPLQNARLVLASASPRRSQLLAQLGLSFEVVPSTIEEVMEGHATPAAIAESLAHQKAAEVAARRPDADLVLGADTIVVLGDTVLGKPLDEADARRMLGMIAGNWHDVYTGYALIANDGRVVKGQVRTEVRIRDLSADEIAAYVRTGEPMDKAGSYAIQGVGALLVAEIRGNYTNVVGLPVPAVDAAWRALGWALL
ncbi:MAG TPA: Maf family protein [Oscillatoriaceae cyanobacterium]